MRRLFEKIDHFVVESGAMLGERGQELLAKRIGLQVVQHLCHMGGVIHGLDLSEKQAVFKRLAAGCEKLFGIG